MRTRRTSTDRLVPGLGGRSSYTETPEEEKDDTSFLRYSSLTDSISFRGQEFLFTSENSGRKFLRVLLPTSTTLPPENLAHSGRPYILLYLVSRTLPLDPPRRGVGSRRTPGRVTDTTDDPGPVLFTEVSRPPPATPCIPVDPTDIGAPERL